MRLIRFFTFMFISTFFIVHILTYIEEKILNYEMALRKGTQLHETT